MANAVSMVSRLVGEIKKNGMKNTYYKVIEKRAKNLELKDYDTERLKAIPSEEELKAQRGRHFVKDVMFSIVVPTYHTPELFLRQMIESVLGQTFCRVELCIADGSSDDSVERIVTEYQKTDARIRYRRLEENKGISENTNEGLKMAEGDYIGLLDHDDLLEPHALYEMRMAIAKYPDAEVFYSDEDKVSFDLSHYFEPHLKPEFNPDLLRCNNYICHFLVMKRALLERVGGFRAEYDGAQDFDLVLRLTEKAEQVIHIPKVLYHWRSHEASTATNPLSKLYAYENGRKAVEDHLKRQGVSGTVKETRFYGYYQIIYDVPEELSADYFVLSAKDKNPKKLLSFFDRLSHRQKSGNVIYYEEGFNNFVINSGRKKTESDVAVFVHGGLAALSEEGILQLEVNCLREDIGMAGGRILSEKGLVLFGRKEPNREGVPVYADAGLPKGFTGHFHKSVMQQNTEGVSPYLFAVRRELLAAWEPGEEKDPEALMQELCSFVKASGYRIAYVPMAEAVMKS